MNRSSRKHRVEEVSILILIIIIIIIIIRESNNREKKWECHTCGTVDAMTSRISW